MATAPVTVLGLSTAAPPHLFEQRAVADLARQVYARAFGRHPKLDERTWMQAYREAFTGFYSVRRLFHTVLTVAGGRGLAAEARRSTLRQFLYYFFSYRQRRHPMVGGIWQIRRRDVRRAAITDDEARRHYLGGNAWFDAVLGGSEGGFAAAPA